MAACAALAHPAGAVSLPVSSLPVASAPLSTAATTALSPVADPIGSLVTDRVPPIVPGLVPPVHSVVPPVSDPVESLTPVVPKAVNVPVIPSQVDVSTRTGGGARSGTGPTTGPSSAPTPFGAGSSVGPHGPAGAAGLTTSLLGAPLRSDSVAPPPPPAPPPAPAGPSPAPTAPTPLPISPLSADGTSGFSPPGQGNGPLGSLPPSSLLMPALVVGGVLLVRGKKPRLLVDARSSPPG